MRPCRRNEATCPADVACKAFDTERFVEDVKEALERENNIIIAVSEGGRKDARGNYVGEEMKSGKEDAFGHKYLSGIGKYLEQVITAHELQGPLSGTGSSSALRRIYTVSGTDVSKSRNLGAFAAVGASG